VSSISSNSTSFSRLPLTAICPACSADAKVVFRNEISSNVERVKVRVASALSYVWRIADFPQKSAIRHTQVGKFLSRDRPKRARTPRFAGAYRELRKDFPQLALVIAPHHLEHTPEVENALRAASLDYVKASELNSPSAARDADVLILDTMGQLRCFYRRGSIALVGGSLAPGRGGQNPAEPALVDVPVLIGPYHESQEKIVSSLVGSGGARIVKNARDIIGETSKWLGDDEARQRAGRNAHDAVKRRSSGARFALKQIEKLI